MTVGLHFVHRCTSRRKLCFILTILGGLLVYCLLSSNISNSWDIFEPFKYLNNLQVVNDKNSVTQKAPSTINTIINIVSFNFTNNTNPFHYSISPLACKSDVKLLIIVCASWSDISRRQATRRTWAYFKNNTSTSARVVFVYGFPQSSKDSDSNLTKITSPPNHDEIDMRKEANEFGDVVYTADFVDTYKNLTLKSLAGLNWALDYCPEIKYVMKVDSDVFIQLNAVFHSMETSNKSANNAPHIIGNVQRNAVVNRDKNAKWFVDAKVFSGYAYPNYATGPGYLVSISALKMLVEHGNEVFHSHAHIFVWEDVAVTGIWRQSLNILLLHWGAIQYSSFNKNSFMRDPCKNIQNVALYHRVNSMEMYFLHSYQSQILCPKGSN